MIGKANEIKTVMIAAAGVNDWLNGNSESEIIDIKYAVTPSTENQNRQYHALIIYKEVIQ